MELVREIVLRLTIGLLYSTCFIQFILYDNLYYGFQSQLHKASDKQAAISKLLHITNITCKFVDNISLVTHLQQASFFTANIKGTLIAHSDRHNIFKHSL